MKEKGKKVVYNEDYYKTQILLKNKDFIKTIKKLKDGFKDLGCPLPKDGLKSDQDFEAWNKKYWSLIEIKIKAKKEIPDIYNGVFYDLLKENGVDPNNDYYRNFLKRYVFFNEKEPNTVPVSYKVTINNKTKEYELYIRIFPHTTKEDIDSIWKLIEKEKKIIFKDKKVRSRAWQYMDRDFKIFDIYEKIKMLSPEEKRKISPDIRTEQLILKKLSSKYENISYETIRGAINKVKRYINVIDKK